MRRCYSERQINLPFTITLREDAHGFCEESCRFQRPKSGAANDIRHPPMPFAIKELLSYLKEKGYDNQDMIFWRELRGFE